MTLTTIQLAITPKRLLTEVEAAHHCGRSKNRFKIECPVEPVVFPNGDRRYDVKDLDCWIDAMKGGEVSAAESIIARLV